MGLRSPCIALGNARFSAHGLGAKPSANHGDYGWTFRGTDEDGLSLIFDVHRAEDGRHVQRACDYWD